MSQERQEYMLTPEQFKRLQEAGKPAPQLVAPGGAPLPVETPEQSAGRFWRELGEELGFEWTSVGPAPDRPPWYFSAVPLPDPAALPVPPREH